MTNISLVRILDLEVCSVDGEASFLGVISSVMIVSRVTVRMLPVGLLIVNLCRSICQAVRLDEL
jgi:hypothetical protein